MAETAKVRASGEQLKQQINEVRKSIESISAITLALIPPDSNILINDKEMRRKEIKDLIQANDRALAQIASAVGKGVRKHAAGEGAATKSHASGGLAKPSLYGQELVSFFSSAQLGKVDPTNPKSEDISAVIKRSAFGKHGIATSYTFSRLFPLLVAHNGFKDKTNGQRIAFPAGYLEKHFPAALASLKAKGADTTVWTYINVGRLVSESRVPTEALTAKQKEDLATYTDLAVALDTLTKDVHVKSKKADAPAPVVPASLAAAPSRRSPAKTQK